SSDRSGLSCLLTLQHDFPSQWNQFRADENRKLNITVKREHFPYLTQGKSIRLKELQLHALKDSSVQSETMKGMDVSQLSDSLNDAASAKFELSLAAGD